MHVFLTVFLFLSSLLPGHASPFTQRMDRVAQSVTHITGEKTVMSFFGPMHGNYICTGFVIAPHRVLTAAHCLGEVPGMRSDGFLVQSVVRVDEKTDLMLLDVVTQDVTGAPKPALVFRDAPVVRYEALNGVGYGFGFTRLITTFNTVMLLDYSPNPNDMAPGIWVSQGYHPGMSGGPVVDQDGLVVGMVQRSTGSAGYGVGVLLMRAFLIGT